MRRRSVQLELALHTWGGRRAGAGRKPKGKRAGVPHRRRPLLAARYPVHVTLKLVRGLCELRTAQMFRLIQGALVAGRAKTDFRVCHFSVQADHIHLIVEAHDATALSRGIQGLGISIAKRINGALARRGRVFADRFHARILRTPSEVRSALDYVINNRASHIQRLGVPHDLGLWMDPYSSAAYFDGWRRRPRRRPGRKWPPPVSPPRTWLLEKGWRRRGLLEPGRP